MALIKVGFLDKKGRKQYATYTTNNKERTDEIVRRERKKSNVVSIQVGSTYVFGGPNS